MMNRLMIYKLLVIVLACACSICVADQRWIELNDGSRIQGEVISMTNGKYRIRSESLGIVHLNENQVKSISLSGSSNPQSGISRSANSRSANSRSAITQQKAGVEAIQSSLINNTSIMESIMKLQNDPDMMAVLRDPEVMSAVQRLDFEALRNNPRFKRLLENSQVRQIQSKVR